VAALDEYPVWLLEFRFETTRAATHLICTGTLQRVCNMKFQLSHGGGTVPFLATDWRPCRP
jgi:hypothetical protein